MLRREVGASLELPPMPVAEASTFVAYNEPFSTINVIIIHEVMQGWHVR